MTETPAWRPLLEGPLREQALDAVRDIAEALRNPPPTPVPNGTNAEAAATLNLGLCTGRAGIGVFFGYLAKAGLLEDAEELAASFLEEAEAGLATHWMGPSLCQGFSGIAWAHAHLHQTLFREPDRGALKEIDEALIALLSDRDWQDEFDLLYGLVGLGVYALERLPRPRARTMLKLVIERLEELAERLPDGVAWRTPQDEYGPRGDYSLGMAHGVPGVIALLARAAAAQVERRKALPLLADAVRWLRAQRLPLERGGGFSSFTPLPGEVPHPSRVAWCYGDPGVAAALLPAAGALDLPQLEEEALRLALAATERPRDETGVEDAPLCHGAAGLGHLYNRLFHARGHARFGSAARGWFARTLELRQPGTGVAGFAPAPHPDSANTPGYSRDSGLLTGAAGVGLALLAATTPVVPAWDRVLLLDLTLPAVKTQRDQVAGFALQSR